MVGSPPMTRLDDLKRFYSLLEKHLSCQEGKCALANIGSFNIPKRGVYFIFDDNELRQDSGGGPRVVRIGTHGLRVGSDSELPGRLAHHRGKADGDGNHRGSIFRLLVGQVLAAQRGPTSCPSWGLKKGIVHAALAFGIDEQQLVASELTIEKAVSEYLSRLQVAWLDIDDEPGPRSLRGYIEQNSIALLSNYERPALDPPSGDWLGHKSNRPRVRCSGLWNQHHVAKTPAAKFLDVLARLVDRQRGSVVSSEALVGDHIGRGNELSLSSR